jgi:transposase
VIPESYTTGKKYKNEGHIELKRGYSKDHRMDLKQLIYLLVTTEDGIPLFAECHSGNAADNELFQNTMIKVQNLLKNEIKDKVYVLDAALYCKEFLLNGNIEGDWVTRVPESVKLCKQYLETDYDKILWTKVDKDYKFIEVESSYGGIYQRWLIVRNREAKFKEIATFKKQLIREEGAIGKSIATLEKKIFYSKEEAVRDIEMKKKYHIHFNFTYKIQGIYGKDKETKRKIRFGYMLVITFRRDEKKIKKSEMRKGKFILATDCLNDEKLSSKDILSAYRGRNKSSESCFKFLKDKTHNLNQIFLKKESRIEAMMMVMSLVLFTNNLAKTKLRNHLKENNKSIPAQRGKETQKPTFKWASYFMRNITKVKITVNDIIYDQIKGIDQGAEAIIRAFGEHALKIYGLN